MNPLELFDTRNGHIVVQEQAEYLMNLSDAERNEYLKGLADYCISFLEHYKNDYKSLQTFAYSYAVDLYRTASYLLAYYDRVYDYLRWTAFPMFNWFKAHGLQLHLLIANDFSDFIRPNELFYEFFSGTGILYISPCCVAFQMMKEDGFTSKDFSSLYLKYKNAAVEICDELVKECISDHRSYIYLDINEDDIKHFDASLSYREKDGHLVAFKSTGPEDGKGKIFFSDKGLQIKA